MSFVLYIAMLETLVISDYIKQLMMKEVQFSPFIYSGRRSPMKDEWKSSVLIQRGTGETE